MNEPRARVIAVDGQLVLVDPDAAAVVATVNDYNLAPTFDLNRARIAHFKKRIAELGRSPQELLIVVLNADHPVGGPLADLLMPGADWQQYRDRGEVPFASGLTEREPMQQLLDDIAPDAGEKLRAIEGAAVVIMDHEAVGAYPA